jgi:hypothetical protein
LIDRRKNMIKIKRENEVSATRLLMEGLPAVLEIIKNSKG